MSVTEQLCVLAGVEFIPYSMYSLYADNWVIDYPDPVNIIEDSK